MVCKNNQYKVVDLEFEKSNPLYPSVDFLTFYCNKLKIENDMKITYDEKPCKIYLKTVFANVIKGYHLKRNTNLQIISISFSDMVWKIFATLMKLTNKRNKKLKYFANPILTQINCNRKLLLTKMNYIDNLVVLFDKVYDIDYQEKTRVLISTYVCSRKIMLPA